MGLLEQLKENKGTISSALGKELASRVLDGDVGLLSKAVRLVQHESGSIAGRNVRAGAAKIVEKVAEKTPGLVAPHLSDLAPALDQPEAQTRWMIIRTFGYCAAENSEAARTALGAAERFLAARKGVCLTAATALYLGDIGRLSRDDAARVFPVLARALPKASENEADWMLEAIIGMIGNLDRQSASKAVMLAAHLESAKKKSTLRRLGKLRKLVGQLAVLAVLMCSCSAAEDINPRGGGVVTQASLSIVILAVEDLEEASQFYDEAFGWPRRIDMPVIVEYALPDGRGLALYQRKSFAANTGRLPPMKEGYGTTGTELYLRSDDLDGTIQRLERAGARPLARRTVRPWGDEAAYFADPDGNIIAVSRPVEVPPAGNVEEGGIIIERELMHHASAAETFTAWTTVAGVREFFAPDAHIELRAGGAYEIYFVPEAPEGSRGSEGCTVIEFEENRHLAFTWNFPPSLPAIRSEHTRIDLWFEAIDDESTGIRLVHSGWGTGRDWQLGLQYFEEAWDLVLDRLNHSVRIGPVDWESPPR